MLEWLFREKKWRNFALVEVSHLTYDEIFNSGMEKSDPENGNPILSVKPEAEKAIEERIKIAKEIIDTKTKERDTIAIEDPEKFDYALFQREYRGTKFEPYWGIMEKQLNMYFEIAEYARKKNRTVVSLESGTQTPGTRFSEAVVKAGYHSMEKMRRIEYLYEIRRDISMRKRIQKIKPSLVMVAFSHAVSIEHEFKPREALYTLPKFLPKTMEELKKIKKEEIKSIRERHKEYTVEKKARRARITQEKGIAPQPKSRFLKWFRKRKQ